MGRRLSGRVVIATHNNGKLAEMRHLLAPHGVEAVLQYALVVGAWQGHPELHWSVFFCQPQRSDPF